MDDGVARPLTSGVVEHFIEEDEATRFDGAQDQQEQQRRYKRELDERLPARSVATAATPALEDVDHGVVMKSELAKMLVRVNDTLSGSPRRVSPKSMPKGTSRSKS